MKFRILIILIASVLTMNASAQTFFTRNAKVSFFSKAPIENIQAVNNEVTSMLDTKKGEFAFFVLIKSFKFQKALMEEHFNENYMESNTFPKANFKGSISDLASVNFDKDGGYAVKIKGDLTIHGVTKNVETPGTLTVSQGKIAASSKFTIRIKDYNIKIPTTVVNNISEVVDITVDCKYEPYKKG